MGRGSTPRHSINNAKLCNRKCRIFAALCPTQSEHKFKLKSLELQNTWNTEGSEVTLSGWGSLPLQRGGAGQGPRRDPWLSAASVKQKQGGPVWSPVSTLGLLRLAPVPLGREEAPSSGEDLGGRLGSQGKARRCLEMKPLGAHMRETFHRLGLSSNQNLGRRLALDCRCTPH